MNVPAGSSNCITNGLLNAENTQWQTNSDWWNGLQPSRRINLGGLFDITSLRVQADNRDSYMLQYWSEPSSMFLDAYSVRSWLNGGGTATRAQYALASSIQTNKQRLFAADGDNSYSVS